VNRSSRLSEQDQDEGPAYGARQGKNFTKAHVQEYTSHAFFVALCLSAVVFSRSGKQTGEDS
jgi:hypothetical protein